MPFQIYQGEARSILSPTGGFIREAGFTHSLTPARNCTFACSYCYVPTMQVYGGLKPEDWRRWGQFTTFKSNAAALLDRTLRPEQIVYCSPLVDPYQPAEEDRRAMPDILDALLRHPPQVFVVQTRGPLIVRDLDRLLELKKRSHLRVSFSLTTNREPVRRIFEPHCAPMSERLAAIATLRQAGIRTFATLAPILPCDPEELAAMALDATGEDIIADPFHVRAVKRHGATTREAGIAIAARHGYGAWLDPAFQQDVLARMRQVIDLAGRRLGVGIAGFSWLAASEVDVI